MAELLLIVLVVVAVAVVALYASRALFQRVTVFEYERGLRYDKGRFAGVVQPGQYWLPRWRSVIAKVDARPTVATVPGQEVVTADGVSIRVSVAAEYEIVDPNVAVNQAEDYMVALYVAVQLALRQVVGSAPIEQLLEHRREIGPKLVELVAPRAEELGLKLHRLDAKDLMFAGDLRRTFAQVVAARQEGLAALERARGETAALRNLANAARMIESNPGLFQLRLVQQLGATGGNTIVLGLPSSTTPVPLRSPEEPPELTPESE